MQFLMKIIVGAGTFFTSSLTPLLAEDVTSIVKIKNPDILSLCDCSVTCVVKITEVNGKSEVTNTVGGQLTKWTLDSSITRPVSWNLAGTGEFTRVTANASGSAEFKSSSESHFKLTFSINDVPPGEWTIPPDLLEVKPDPCNCKPDAETILPSVQKAKPLPASKAYFRDGGFRTAGKITVEGDLSWTLTVSETVSAGANFQFVKIGLATKTDGTIDSHVQLNFSSAAFSATANKGESAEAYVQRLNESIQSAKDTLNEAIDEQVARKMAAAAKLNAKLQQIAPTYSQQLHDAITSIVNFPRGTWLGGLWVEDSGVLGDPSIRY